jgi:hypothetical protein
MILGESGDSGHILRLDAMAKNAVSSTIYERFLGGRKNIAPGFGFRAYNGRSQIYSLAGRPSDRGHEIEHLLNERAV